MNLKERIAKAARDAIVARNIRKQEKHWKWVNYRPATGVKKLRYEGVRDIR